MTAPDVSQGALRQIRLILGFGLRRWLNTNLAVLTAGQKTIPGAARRAPTGRKRAGMGALTVLFGVMTLFVVALFAAMFFESLGFGQALQAGTYQRLEQIGQIAQTAPQTGSFTQKQAARERGVDEARQLIAEDATVQRFPAAQQGPLVQALVQHWVAYDLRPDRHPQELNQPDFAYPVQYNRLVNYSTIVLLTLSTFLLLVNLGHLRNGLGCPDPTMLFLLALPVRARVIFATRLFEYTFFDFVFWSTVPAVLTVAAFFGGHGYLAPVLGLALCLPVAVTLACIRLLAQALAQRHLPLRWRKDVQVACVVLSTLMLFGFMGAAQVRAVALPELGPFDWSLLPLTWVLRACFTPGAAAGLWLLASVAVAAALAWATLVWAERSVRGGFIHDPGTLQGVRSPVAAARPAWAGPALSLMAKDLLLLRRDRLFLFNVIGLPVLICLMWLLQLDRADLSAASFRQACAALYGLGAYLLIPGATTALASEGPALGIVFCSPLPLQQVIRRKFLLWLTLALIFTGLGLAAILISRPWPGLAALADLTMLALGLPIMAAVAVGIGAASTDVQGGDGRLAVEPAASLALMGIAAMHTQAILFGEPHARLLWLCMSAVLAYALWQRLDARLAWLLDPLERPARRIDLADGALAALAFIALQALLGIFLDTPDAAGPQAERALLLSFAGAGLLVASGTLWVLWRQKLRDALVSTGLVPTGPWRQALLASGLWGSAGGLAAALAAKGYLAAINPAAATAAGPPLSVATLVLLVVVLAPLCEEFIFRGLLFTGLRATLPVPWAVAASSAAFALIHPGVSVVPVFIMGCVAAVVFQRCGWLLGPVITHAVYNGLVVFG
jgi:ABC-2 type transport system permease protein